MKALVLRTSGTNCDLETVAVCEKVGFETERHHVRRLIESPDQIDRYAFVVFPGGFSYGDDLGAGTVLANEVRLHLRDRLEALRRRGGLILGICNGFQTLVKTGLLPDPEASRGEVTLAPNTSGRFEDRWVYLKVSSDKSEFLMEGQVLEMPVAHGEGRFTAACGETIDRLQQGGQVVLRYVAPTGGEADYPFNPNGSDRGIAGICDPTGRVLGLMPHPERYQDPLNHPEWTRLGVERRPDGLRLFQNAYGSLRGKRK
jgi:phosphoribosylformylglycinamidine synthase subunit PurQ / glutaminase